MGRDTLTRGLLGGVVASILLLTSSAAVNGPTSTLRAPATRVLDSATGGTPAPSSGLGATPTPAPILTPEVAPNSKCSNGYPGVESENGKTCCMAYCVECAGVGCSGRGNSSDCCATEISLESEECDIAGEAPCFFVPPEPWEPEHTMVYFAYFVIIPFIFLAILCNYSLLPCFREKADPDDPATTAHLRGHNTGPSHIGSAARAPSPATSSVQAKLPPAEADGAPTL